ncbi:MAG: hypothetical protein HYX34_06075 [Actinobacteria bacterium]|nr:hypothetical protein [Actinomycetota bacterium]
MPGLRLSSDQQVELAVDELARLGSRTPQLDVVPRPSGRVELRSLEGAGASARVIAYDAVGEARVRQLMATEARGPKVVVANRISEAARALLSEAGWSWYDRRVGARLVLGRHVFHLAPESRSSEPHARRMPAPAADGPIRGRAGIAYAAALLCRPSEPPSLRSIAAEVDMSPTSISNAARLLAEAGLAVDGRPEVPDLFWALAAVWGPLKAAAVGTAPDPHEKWIRPNLERLGEAGWALAGDLAALEFGAPLVTADDRLSLWVPTQAELRRGERHLGASPRGDQAATISVPPTPLVTRWRQQPIRGEWPLPHPVFVALDLATAAGRGREILDQWTPEGAEPVWRG